MSKTLPLLLITSALALAACSGKSKDDVASASTTPINPALAVPNGPPAVANPTVGGVPMMATQTIVDNASAAPNLSTLVAAVKAAGLVPTLSGPGPFTVFAPTNDAFGRLAPGMVDTLLKPENKASLTKVLTYHVVPGVVTADDLRRRITAGGGTATLTTVEGDPITATLVGAVITLTDVNGNKSYVETADVRQSNGIVHIVNGVIVPKLS
ncbi:putative surface protein with fasciclin (FAS1) repeats [Sphingomonas sp. PP-F2F-G114-C0414]|uniref:fasciclin domain-containing protein n=1 Tax=Sphingomonas sp. PP-F2F-G114-C0414 TaxID=2135662 RepID=UPI000EF8953D|nr:fasciclin domain-containing protein [Sphingomonas sp. PP-F2F-G114-C0414]RMB37096.1 putative surface protein with fasciclin (FAS1) repeats [Sphingomonas sp. PP-F2F-G114-C0414]